MLGMTDPSVTHTIHRSPFQSSFFLFFSSLFCRTHFYMREKGRECHNCLSPLPDKTATANNAIAWDLCKQTRPDNHLSLSLSLPAARSHQLSQFTVSCASRFLSSNPVKNFPPFISYHIPLLFLLLVAIVLTQFTRTRLLKPPSLSLSLTIVPKNNSIYYYISI